MTANPDTWTKWAEDQTELWYDNLRNHGSLIAIHDFAYEIFARLQESIPARSFFQPTPTETQSQPSATDLEDDDATQLPDGGVVGLESQNDSWSARASESENDLTR